jgi:HAD superfamily hydrolase (TIGR01509 family)
MTGEQFSEWCRSEAHITLDIDSFYDCYCDIFFPNEGVMKLIEQLRPVSQLLLLSNTNPWHFPYCDRKFDIRSRFDHTILSYEAGAMKPARAIYLAAMPHIRHPERVVFIDDHQEHLDGAEPFGIQGVRFVEISQLRTDLVDLGYL